LTTYTFEHQGGRRWRSWIPEPRWGHRISALLTTYVMATMRQFTVQQVNFARADLQKRQVRAITGTVQGNPIARGLAIHLWSEVPTQLNYLVGFQLVMRSPLLSATTWPYSLALHWTEHQGYHGSPGWSFQAWRCLL
jgi:hypothetical protein